MAESSASVPGAPRPATKRAFFAKAALPKSTPKGDNEDFFRQSGQVFQSIVAERELRKQQRAAKKAKEREAPRTQEEGESGARKKRRISQEDEDGSHSDLQDVGQQRTPTRPRTRSQTQTPTKVRRSPRGLSSRYNDALKAAKSNKRSEIIELGSDSASEAGKDDDEDVAHVQKRPQTAPKAVIIPNEEEADDDDPEIRALVEHIRASRQQLQLQEQRLSALSSTSTPRETEAAKPKGPALDIFINTDIEGKKPVVIKVNLDHRIKDIREAWCKYNIANDTMAPDEASKIIITWRGLKQWDVTVLRTMLKNGADITVDDDGVLCCHSGRGDGLTSDFSKIHVEATTQELFDEAKARERAEQRRRRPGPVELPAEDHAGGVGGVGGGDNDHFDNDHEEHAAAEAAAAPKKDEPIKIVLKDAKEYGELRLKIRADDPFAKLVRAFRFKQNVPEDKEVFLMFDGERLRPDDALKDTEIEADDIIEVYVR